MFKIKILQKFVDVAFIQTPLLHTSIEQHIPHILFLLLEHFFE